MTDDLTIAPASSLTAAEVTAVTHLAARAAASDGFAALNEAALLHLRHERGTVTHLLARRRGTLVGYAQLEAEREAESGDATATGQLVVSPPARRSGVGSALLAELIGRTPAPLRIWAMGNSAAAQTLATSQHLVAVRELLIMTRSLAGRLPSVPVPPDTTLRTFVVGQDESEWVGVNARAFHSHPEQGQVTRRDLEDRMAESWFDPAGFFLAIRTDRSGGQTMVGFHWTKQHPDLLGEVYVLGVDPSAGGGGLGKALLSRGLLHLKERGNTTVQLYVEADSRAVGLYKGYGFTVESRDVMYAQP